MVQGSPKKQYDQEKLSESRVRSQVGLTLMDPVFRDVFFFLVRMDLRTKPLEIPLCCLLSRAA